MKWVILIAALLSGCATTVADHETAEIPLRGNPAQHKSIFVFLDGTRNDTASGTNVRKAYEAIRDDHQAQTTGIYIEGVGSRETQVLGSLLGLGMEPRILRGYDFVARHYRAGDDLYIIGFSRGAHQARALAGLLAYAGLPDALPEDASRRYSLENKIIEVVKDKNDIDYLDRWKAWRPGQPAMLAAEIRDRVGLSMNPVEIAFVGVWDTVPGSLFKKFDECMEQKNGKEGDRYKSASYPPIHHIAHAVSRDEKRSRFEPILLCKKIEGTTSPKVQERWFPGAHADVGGGYEDAQGLEGQPFNWMMTLIAQHYQSANPLPVIKADPLGLAHWSIGDWPGNLFSHCKNRSMPDDADKDPSIGARADEPSVPIRVDGKETKMKYPVICG